MDKTVSELVYAAWVNTDKPLLYETKTEIKEINFANPVNNKYFDANFRGICNLCGAEITNGGIPAKKFFSNNYMDYPIHKNPESTHICKACGFCLGMNPTGRIALFRYPIIAEKTLHLCSRDQFREYLLNPPEPPFVMIFPTSQKKHLFSKSKVSYSKKCFFCNLEETTIFIDSSINKLIKTIDALRGIGLSLENIRNNTISTKVIKKYNFSSQERLINLMNEISASPMMGLALTVSKIQEEDKAVCYLDLTQKTL